MYKISIDTGGTFTDCISEKNGIYSRLKLLSKSVLRSEIVEIISEKSLKIKDNWGLKTDFFQGFYFRLIDDNGNKCKIESFDPSTHILILDCSILFNNHLLERSFDIFSDEEVPVFATRILTETPLNQPFPKLELKLGSTKGTNALLESKGAKVLFIVTKGFKDLLLIGNQSRPDIFTINIIKPKPLHNIVIEVEEQIDSQGRIIIPIDVNKVFDQISLIENEFESIAICFKNSYKNAIHEAQLFEFLKTEYKYISYSSQLSSHIKFLHRAETTVVNSYLSPLINTYLFGIKQQLNNSFLIMTSAGNLVANDHFTAKDSLLSGPAGGIVGAVNTAKKSGFEHIISFDMGGTSTDVARYDGAFDYKSEITIGSANIFSPALSIETVAAGGGSICSFDGFKLKVGPESAGSDPGPACYGAGGALTITDVNLLLGRIDTSLFSIPIYKIDAENRLSEILFQIQKATEDNLNKEEILESFLQIANEKMADSIKKISIAKGFDTTNYVLVAYGGAGGMHACALANLLNIDTILIPSDAGLLSAYGISQSLIQKIVERPILRDFTNDNLNFIQSQLNAIKQEGIRQLIEMDITDYCIQRQTIKLRLKNQESTLDLPFLGDIDLDREFLNFKEKYQSIYGHWHESLLVEVASIEVQVSEKEKDSLFVNKQTTAESSDITNNQPIPKSRQLTFIAGNWYEVKVYSREKLKCGDRIEGFAILVDPFATIFIEKGWDLTIDQNYAVVLKRAKSRIQNLAISKHAELELFTNRFMAIAEQMGVMLQRTALSVNVKERLDFSCAVLDANAQLIANAPHIPVHLGSLGVCVRKVLEYIKIDKDDVVITNHPKYGGSHLPDVTLISAVYDANNVLIGYVASRCHHAEIGGIRPASMPPNASNLEEEGVVIEPIYLVKKGIDQFESIRERLLSAKYPSRAFDENMADISAALAANTAGKMALLDLASKYGNNKITHFMQLLLDNSCKIMHHKFLEMGAKQFSASEFLDDGTLLKVEINISRAGDCLIDFKGTSSVHLGNLNANEAIVKSVIVYVLRLMVQKNIPLNEGLMQKVKVLIPENSILNPFFHNDPAKSPAVVGGNVETSQRLTDTILKALGIVACSQGTMNNTLFGNETFGYYETLCGGAGAGDGFHGASAVHTHMTNTRITDPEIMELRYPVHLKRFAIRENSGGKGKYYGGNGIVREIEFLKPIKLSVLSQHRINSPYGLQGGANGELGRQYIIKKSGKKIDLKGNDAADLEAGDCFVIETPGGGGWEEEK